MGGVKDKLEMVASLISQSPPGEFADVLHGDDNLLLKLYEFVKLRNLENGSVVRYELNGSEWALLLTKNNMQADGSFLDPSTEAKVQVNHYNLEVESVAKDDIGQRSPSDLREAVHKAAGKYAQASLPKGNFLVYSDADASLKIKFVGDRFQSKNMRNGQWQSSWECNIDNSVGCIQLRGEVRALVHYFEDGNVQLNARKTITADQELPSSYGVEDQAAAIIAAIKKAEDQVQFALNESYAQVSENTFRKLRRQLPLTRSKVDWGKLASYKVGDQLPAGHQSVRN